MPNNSTHPTAMGCLAVEVHEMIKGEEAEKIERETSDKELAREDVDEHEFPPAA